MDSSSISARPDVTVATTAPRVTPTPPRTHFKEVLAQSLVTSAQAAMKVLPGSPLMAVAIRGAAGTSPSVGVPMTGASVRSATLNLSPEGPNVSGPSDGSLLANAAAGAAGAALAGVAGATDATWGIDQARH